MSGRGADLLSVTIAVRIRVGIFVCVAILTFAAYIQGTFSLKVWYGSIALAYDGGAIREGISKGISPNRAPCTNQFYLLVVFAILNIKVFPIRIIITSSTIIIRPGSRTLGIGIRSVSFNGNGHITAIVQLVVQIPISAAVVSKIIIIAVILVFVEAEVIGIHIACHRPGLIQNQHNIRRDVLCYFCRELFASGVGFQRNSIGTIAIVCGCFADLHALFLIAVPGGINWQSQCSGNRCRNQQRQGKEERNCF